MKYLRKMTAILVISMMMLFLCASCLQELLIPGFANPKTVKWAGVPPKMFMPYTTLWDLKRIQMAMDFKMGITDVEYAYHTGIISFAKAASESLGDVVFGPTSPIAPIIMGLGGGTVGALFIPRKKDKEEIERLKNGG